MSLFTPNKLPAFAVPSFTPSVIVAASESLLDNLSIAPDFYPPSRPPVANTAVALAGSSAANAIVPNLNVLFQFAP